MEVYFKKDAVSCFLHLSQRNDQRAVLICLKSDQSSSSSLPETERVNGCLSVSMTTQMRLMSTTVWKKLSIQNPKITSHQTNLKRWQRRKRRSVIDRENSAQTSKPV